MWSGTIIEQSLVDTNILQLLNVTKKWTSGKWVLYDVAVEEDVVPLIQKSLGDGPWYVHLWKDSDMFVIFKGGVFKVSRYDTSTWREAIKHGRSIGIPEEQLDFLTE